MGRPVRLGTALERVVSAVPRRMAVTVSAHAVVNGEHVPVPAALEEALLEVIDILHDCAERLAAVTDRDVLVNMLELFSSEEDAWREHVRAALAELSREGGDVDAAIGHLEKALGEEEDG